MYVGEVARFAAVVVVVGAVVAAVGLRHLLLQWLLVEVPPLRPEQAAAAADVAVEAPVLELVLPHCCSHCSRCCYCYCC